MSQAVHKSRNKAQANRNSKNFHRNTPQVLDELNTEFTQLRERIIPAQPYLLSVPSDVPYRHSSRFTNIWYAETPFVAEEEHLQYLSFLSHQGEEDSLLKVLGGWADEKGNHIEEEASPLASLSGRNTPSEQSTRKKISLKDYKSKDKTRPSTPTPSSSTLGIKKQVMKPEYKEHKVVTDGIKKEPKLNHKPGVKTERRDQVKSEPTGLDGASSPRHPATSRQQDLPSPRKRRRLSADIVKREEAPITSEKKRDAEETKGLPALLSPTLPAQKKNSKRAFLPDLLLPDLPPTLEKAVAIADKPPKPDANSGLRTEHVKSVLGSALGSSAGKRPPEKVASNDASATRARADSQLSSRNPAPTSDLLSPVSKPLIKNGVRPTTPLSNGVNASQKPRQRHIVKLRYGKKNRKWVDSLLKLSSRPKKAKVTTDEGPSESSEKRPMPTQNPSEPSKSERKRPADPSPERPTKKAKQLDVPERPSTPKVAAAKSPANLSASTKPRIELATPKKELKSSAMKRIESQEGPEARTPQGDQGRTSTPLSVAGTSQAKVSPGPGSSMSKEERSAWQDLHTKYFTLGRTIKREGTSLGPSPGNEPGEKDQALSVVLLIEALLCFMVNQAAQSRARPGTDPGWSTILPYHVFVVRTSWKYKHLYGLVIQLGAICRQSIHHHDIERLARDPLPFEHCESAPTPGSDGNTKTNDDVERYKKKYIAFRDQLVRNARELQSAWLEGSRHLPMLLIEREYPKTWAKRTKDTSKRALEKVKPDTIGKEYYLPLDVNTTVFEAMRFSMALLREWSDKEKINWKPRIEI